MFSLSSKIKGQLANNIPLIKDPFVAFSPLWFEKEYNSKIIIMIRHPAAFVSSLKVKNWKIGYEGLLKKNVFQSDKILIKYRDKISEFSNSKPDIIDQGILFWNIVHEKIFNYQSEHTEWLFIKHEDLSIDPFNGFKNIFKYLDLPFTKKIIKEIEMTTGTDNSSTLNIKSADIFNINRNSKENINVWKKRLNDEEIDRIKKGTKKISDKFNYEW